MPFILLHFLEMTRDGIKPNQNHVQSNRTVLSKSQSLPPYMAIVLQHSLHLRFRYFKEQLSCNGQSEFTQESLACKSTRPPIKRSDCLTLGVLWEVSLHSLTFLGKREEERQSYLMKPLPWVSTVMYFGSTLQVKPSWQERDNLMRDNFTSHFSYQILATVNSKN